jgi:hypothetical protein
MKDYNPSPNCESCLCNNTSRSYTDDICTLQNSIIKHDSELKTIGDLANRNRDRMSNDQKQELHTKHNSYKEKESQKILPKGMNRIKKPNKYKWT